MNGLVRAMANEAGWQELVDKAYDVVKDQVDTVFCHTVAGHLGLGPKYQVNR